MKKLFYILLLLPQFAIAQISGVINIYTKVTAVDPTCNKVTVSSSTGFSQGDTVLIIQMQGASMDESNNAANFGTVTSYNDAGNYEFSQIYGIDGNDIYLKHTLQRSYTPSGSVQLIYVPQYSDVTITGTLEAKAWDGDTGGVLVFEASGTIDFNADINVSSKGFRGGNPNNGLGDGCSVSNVYADGASTTVSAFKGEGIANFIPLKNAGRGKQVNGGGGGNSNNCGGGGGSNYGTGGNGGRQAYLRTSSYSGCNLFGNGSPGIGGLALTYSNASNKVFLGGGGGGGHQNNWTSPGPPTWVGGTSGGHGGGIVIIRAGTLNGNSRSIIATGGLSPISRAWGDGAGGGGGGGAVLLDVTNFPSPLSIDVSGGKGDDIYDETSRDLGPGGGGGGGILWVSSAGVSPSINLTYSGGASGTMIGSTTCECSHNAQVGNSGNLLTNLILARSTTVFSPACISLPVDLIHFNVSAQSMKTHLTWITANEKNNQEFIIEKSKDLNEFDFVTSIPGSGNSSVSKTYSAFDYNPYEGDSYYRLSQKDMDGTVQVLKVAHVDSESSGNLIKKFYPQPFSTELNIELNEGSLSDKAVISIYNTIGQAVFSIETRSSAVHLPLSHLPRGIYFLTVTSGDQKETVKVVKAE